MAPQATAKPQAKKKRKTIHVPWKDRAKARRYFDSESGERRAAKKLRRILKSNGVDAAKQWAAARGLTSILMGLK